MKIEQMSEILPYLAYEDGAVIMKDGRISFFYEVDGVEFEGWTAKEYESMVENLESAFREMPNHTTFEKTDIYYQVTNELKPTNDSYLEKKRVEHYNKRSSILFKSYICLTFAPEKLAKPTPNSTILARKGKNLPSKLLLNIEERVFAASAKASEFTALIGEIPKVKFKKMEEEEIKTIICQYLNLDFENKEHDVHSEVEKKHNHLLIGNKMVNVVSLDGQGDNLYYYGEKRYTDTGTIMNPFASPVHFALQTPHIVVTSMTKVDLEDSLKPFKSEVLINTQLSGNSPMSRGAGERAEAVKESIDIVRKLKGGLVMFGMNIILYSDDYKIHKESLEKAQRAIKSIEQANYRIESWDIQNLYYAGLPGNAWENVRTLRMPSINAMPYFHFMKSYNSDKIGELMTDRFGVPLRVDLNHKDIDVMNRIIVGPSGSGKSFTTGGLISSAHERNEIQVIIDKGGSYENLVKSLSGQYFAHSDEKPLRFNPFDCDKVKEEVDGKETGKTFYVLNEDKTTVLLTFLSVLWKSKADGEYVKKAESTFLLIWIEEYYKHVNENQQVPILKGFVEFIKMYDQKKRKDDDKEYIAQSKYFDINHFSTVLHPFTDGIYAEIFNNEKALDLASFDLICFDVDKIESDPILYPVVTMLIIELVLGHMKKHPIERKHIYLDEAWSFFSGEMGEFIEVMFRTIRKFNGDCSVITQSADDILKCPLSNALIQNSQVFIILNHAGKSTDPLLQIGLEDIHVQKVKSMRKNWFVNSKEGIMGGREIFIKRQDMSFNVYAVEVPIEQYCLLTTKKPEKAHFINLQAKYQLTRAIEEWKKDKLAEVI